MDHEHITAIPKEILAQAKYRVLQPTNWWVITGGPRVGKTTVINELARQGYCVLPEAARTLIDTEMILGFDINEIRNNEMAFQ